MLDLEMRNPMHNALGGIDCEVNHPDFGWIPFTAGPGTGDPDVEAMWKILKDRDDVATYSPPADWRNNHKQTIRNSLEGTVLALVGNPGQAEIASWPNKIEAARRIITGAAEAEIILAPTVAKFGVNMAGAAQIVLLRSRLYELAKVVAESTEAATLTALEAASPETVQALLNGLQEQIEAHTAEFAAIRAAATAGDMSLIEAAEAQLLSG